MIRYETKLLILKLTWALKVIIFLCDATIVSSTRPIALALVSTCCHDSNCCFKPGSVVDTRNSAGNFDLSSVMFCENCVESN